MNPNLLLAIPMLPLAAAIIAGLGGRVIGRAVSAGLTIAAVAASCILSLVVLDQLLHGTAPYNATVYTWLLSDGVNMQVGFLIDRLSALMMVCLLYTS